MYSSVTKLEEPLDGLVDVPLRTDASIPPGKKAVFTIHASKPIRIHYLLHVVGRVSSLERGSEYLSARVTLVNQFRVSVRLGCTCIITRDSGRRVSIGG